MTGEQALVGGRYQLIGTLGQGGMATVRRGFDTRLNRPVAVKQLMSSLAADPICQERFRREARSAASLSHPAIVAVFDTGAEKDPVTGLSIPYLVMELVEGQTLRSVLRDTPKVLPERALELTREVLAALSHSHDAGIVHRDIKPANVMVTTVGDVKVMDFGIARTITDTSTDFTQTASVVGTAHYLSPEQARGERVGVSSDLYSVGCLLYELLTGRPPFVGETVLSVVYQHVREAPVPPSERDPAIGPDIDAVVLKALAKDPADRFPTAREMREDIDRVLTGDRPAAPPLPVVATPVSSAAEQADQPTTVVPRARSHDGDRRHWGLALGAVLVAMLTLLGGYGLYRSNEPSLAAAGQLVSVPDLVGRSRAQAEQALQQAQLEVRVRIVRGDRDQTLNTVVGQSPASGRDAPTGSVVTLEVNEGPATVQIPTGLEGRDASTVRATLAALGFRRVTVTLAEDQPADAETAEVLKVRPREGKTVALTDEIVLTVAGPDSTGSSRSGDGQSGGRQSAERTEADKTTEQPDRQTEEPNAGETARSGPDDSEQSSSPSREPSRSASPDDSPSRPTPDNSPTAEPKPTTTPPEPTATPSSSAPESTPDTPDESKPGSDPGKSDPGTEKPDKSKSGKSEPGKSEPGNGKPGGKSQQD